MVNALVILALVVALVVVTSLVWRWGGWPCPSWLVPLLENPYVEAVAGSSLLLRRAGVEPGMQVLDAGCGPGRITLPAAARIVPGGRVVAVDIQPRMLEELERRRRSRGLDNVEALQAGLGEGKLDPDRFDVAFLVTVLGETPDKKAALREIHRSLRAGGVLSITEVLPDPHYQSLARVRQLARETGFREQRLFRGWLSYTINLVKEVAA